MGKTFSPLFRVKLQQAPFCGINPIETHVDPQAHESKDLKAKRAFFSLGHSTSGKDTQVTTGFFFHRRATVLVRQGCHMIRNEVAKCRGTFILGGQWQIVSDSTSTGYIGWGASVHCAL